jgi:hypothetical protein
VGNRAREASSGLIAVAQREAEIKEVGLSNTRLHPDGTRRLADITEPVAVRSASLSDRLQVPTGFQCRI